MTAGDKKLNPGSAAASVAGRIVGKRLKKTARLLTHIASDSLITPEDVHKLRVSTRRTDASIRAFAGITRKKTRKHLRAAMRGSRQAAGLARECDVHREMLRSDFSADSPETAAAIGYLAARLSHDAELARDSLRDHARRTDIRWLRMATDGLFLRKQDGRTYGDIADLALRSASDRVLLASADDLRDLTNLHALRIACKRLRYSVEIFRPCLSPGQAMTALDTLTDIQNRLGNLNDLQDMQRRVETEASRLTDSDVPRIVLTGLTWMRADLHERQNVQRAKFLRWWSGALDNVKNSVRQASERVPRDVQTITHERPTA